MISAPLGKFEQKKVIATQGQILYDFEIQELQISGTLRKAAELDQNNITPFAYFTR